MALAAIVMTGTSAGAAGEELQGVWSAPGALLTVGPDGAVFRQDCSEARFGPVLPDKSGAFRATGAWEDHAPGPQPADAPPPRQDAILEGQFRDDALVLTVRRAGGAAQSFTLLKGKRAKLIRCL